jgi:DNA ligase (NAD+)
MFSNLSTEEQYAYLVKCSNTYYETGHSLISDALFDEYCEIYSKKSGKPFKYLGKSNNKKCTLPVWMGSLDKVKTEDRLNLFLNKYTTADTLVCSEKLDGCSILIYKNSKNNEIQVATRGDGKTGSDLTHLLSFLNISKKVIETIIEKDYVIRGEIIMKNSIFESKFSNDSENARNLVSGLINSKTIDNEKLKVCNIVAYSIPNKEYSPEKTFEILKCIGFETPNYTIYKKKNFTIEFLSNLYSQMCKNSNYLIDGIVISDNAFHSEKPGEDPKYTIAFKVKKEGINATVVDVLWEESRYGILYPRVQIKPVDCDGVTITYLSGKNAQFIVSNKIGPNAILSICRSGDVIPDILNVITPTEAKMPSIEYEWTESVNIRCKEKTKNDKKQISYFLTFCGAKGLKEATIEKCISIGLNTVEKMLLCNLNDLLKAEGIQQKSAEKILEQLTIVKSNCTLLNIMAGSCIFEAFGEKKLQTIITTLQPEIYEVILNDTSYNETNWEKKLNSAGIKTQAPTFLKYFTEFCNDWKKFCKKWCKKEEVKEEVKVDTSTTNKKGSHLNVVFTGIRSALIESQLVQIGATVSENVSKSITHLVVKDKNTESVKMKKARENGAIICSIVEIQEIIKKLN